MTTQRIPKQTLHCFFFVCCMALLLFAMPVVAHAQTQVTKVYNGITFVLIPHGTFNMGSATSVFTDERPVHSVTISTDFYISQYEITQQQWVNVMGTRPWLDSGGNPKQYAQANPSAPAVYVSWNDVQSFISKLNKTAGKTIYWLPTEAEWEYVCRAGTTDDTFFTAPDTLDAYAWYRDDLPIGQQYAQPVGEKDPNPWGLYDVYGNVREWCQDWYDISYYSVSPDTDPAGPDNGQGKVVRGGSFMEDSSYCNSTRRLVIAPSNAVYDVGFRLARAVTSDNNGGNNGGNSSGGGGGGGCFISIAGAAK